MDKAQMPAGAPNRVIEYGEVNSYVRHYSHLRFIMVSVFFVVTAAVVSVFFEKVNSKINILCHGINIFSIIGLGLTCIFAAYEYRLEKLIRYYQQQARKLESALGFNTMSNRPQSSMMFQATRALYIIFFIFWIISFYLVK